MKKIIFFFLLCLRLNAQSVEITNDKVQLNPSVYFRSTSPILPEVGLRSKLGTSFSALRFENENGATYFRLVGTNSESRMEVFNRFILQISNSTSGITDRLTILNNGKVGISTNSPQSDFEVNGFSKLGSDAPAIKVKKLLGTSSAFQGGAVSVAHGLTASKILNVSVVLDFGTNTFIPSSYNFNPGYEFDWYSDATNIIVTNKSNNSGSVLSKPVKILITYEE